MSSNRFRMPAQVASQSAPLIRMRGIIKTFHSAAGQATVLKGLDLDIHQGQFVSVVGRSGSGKSTLVNMITGIDRPTSGIIEVGGQTILHMPESDMAVWRGKHLGIVFQFFQLLPMLTLVENVMLPMDFCNIYPPATRENRALELLARVGVADLAGKLPGAVAGGQQQCAAVARALANDPPILIADEPTGNLDSNTAEQVMCIFEELASQGKTILLVTHDRSLALRTNRRLVISDGELVHESLVRLFPDAPHTRLLRLTKLAVSETLPSGVLLPLVAAQGPVVYIVTSGEILSVHRGDYLHYSPGSLVDPLSLRRNLYAGKTGAGLLALPRQEVLPLLSASRLSPNSEPNYAEAQSHPQNGTSPIARRQQ